MKCAQGIRRSLIRNLHPGLEALVEHGIAETPDSRELCEDYRRCLVTLKKLRQPEVMAQPGRIFEYEELLAHLALEIEAALESSL